MVTPGPCRSYHHIYICIYYAACGFPLRNSVPAQVSVVDGESYSEASGQYRELLKSDDVGGARVDDGRGNGRWGGVYGAAVGGCDAAGSRGRGCCGCRVLQANATECTVLAATSPSRTEMCCSCVPSGRCCTAGAPAPGHVPVRQQAGQHREAAAEVAGAVCRGGVHLPCRSS